MFRSGLVDTLVTHANIKEFGLIPLFGDHGGSMPPLLKTNIISRSVMLGSFMHCVHFKEEEKFHDRKPRKKGSIKVAIAQ